MRDVSQLYLYATGRDSLTVGGSHSMRLIVGSAHNNIDAPTSRYAFRIDIMTWGWRHIIAAIIVLTAAPALFTGAMWPAAS